MINRNPHAGESPAASGVMDTMEGTGNTASTIQDGTASGGNAVGADKVGGDAGGEVTAGGDAFGGAADGVAEPSAKRVRRAGGDASGGAADGAADGVAEPCFVCHKPRFQNYDMCRDHHVARAHLNYLFLTTMPGYYHMLQEFWLDSNSSERILVQFMTELQQKPQGERMALSPEVVNLLLDWFP